MCRRKRSYNPIISGGFSRYCESQRDRALVAVAWDSAARISELLDINIGHVNFDRYGAVISVSGKTGAGISGS